MAGNRRANERENLLLSFRQESVLLQVIESLSPTRKISE